MTEEDVERAVLGALLLDREAAVVLPPELAAEHFTGPRRAIFAAMLACIGRGEPPDLTTVATELRRRGQLDAVGGISELCGLLAATTTAALLERHARRLLTQSVAVTADSLPELAGADANA